LGNLEAAIRDRRLRGVSKIRERASLSLRRLS
jgi:hypothetical protein